MNAAAMPPMLRILHVEDSADDADLLGAELEAAGYRLDYLRVETAAAVREALELQRWDAIISDFNLPALDAYDVLRLLEASGHDLPFIVVSGFIGEEGAVALMKAGAHDYVMKDNLKRLVPAIEREIKEAEERRRRRQADEALAANRKMLENIAAALGEGLLVLDTEQRLVLMNREAERLLGWTAPELAGCAVPAAIHSLRSDGTPLPPEASFVAASCASGIASRAEDQLFVRKNGDLFPVAYVTTPVIEEGRIVATVTVFTDISVRKQAEHELQESRRQLQELSAFLQQVREDERTRIARELHDELGQAMTALRIDLVWLCAKLQEQDRHICDKLAAMLRLVEQTVDSTRRISEDLRPGMLDDLGLPAAIEHHVTKFAEQTGIACELAIDEEGSELDDRVATALFRVLQESLTNVARHAAADRVHVCLKELDKEILLIVKDNGRGLPQPSAERKKTYGLLGMHERVKLLGGLLDISSAPGKGTRIDVSLPLNQEEFAR